MAYCEDIIKLEFYNEELNIIHLGEGEISFDEQVLLKNGDGWHDFSEGYMKNSKENILRWLTNYKKRIREQMFYFQNELDTVELAIQKQLIGGNQNERYC